MSTAAAVREVVASWCLDTRTPSSAEEKRFLWSSRHVVSEWTEYLVGSDAVDDAVLAANELVTNAIRHGCPPYELRLHELPDGLRWSVVDAGPGQLAVGAALARAQRMGSLAYGESGRGLALVVRLFPGNEVRTIANAYGEPATEVSFMMPRLGGSSR